jgi:hypothetical protein
MMDIDALSAKALTCCGIRLQPNDPAFVLLALNQMVLEEATRVVYDSLDAKMAVFSESLHKTERSAGKAFAEQVQAAALEVRRAIQNDVKEANWRARELILQMDRANRRPAVIKWTVTGALAAVFMFACGVCFGWYFPLT